MKILIIRLSSIGDIILTTPVVRALKTQMEDVEIHFCTKKQYECLVTENPYIDKVHLLNDSLLDLTSDLRREKYDLVIDLHHNIRSFFIKGLMPGVKKKSFRKINFEKWLMVKFKLNKLPNLHIVDRYHETIKSLGVKKDELGLDYFIPDKDEVEKDWLPETHRKEYIVFAIGGQHATKKLPFGKMVELCDKINKPIILLGGPEDAKTGDQVEKFFKKNGNDPDRELKLKEGLNKKADVYNGCGKFNINQSASIVKGARVVFTHDTGIMHIAAAFKKEVFSIWGNTIPQFGMYPYRTKFTVFENTKIQCRPCSKIGHHKCPKGHFKCMKDIVFDFYIP